MTEKYYGLNLDDPSLPGFCSGSRLYIGTEEDIREVIARMSENDTYPETVRACIDYFNGNKTAKHNVSYQDIPVLKPAHYVCAAEMEIGRKEWEHLNTWGFPYLLKFDSAKIRQLVVKYGRKYLLCLKVKMKDLALKNCLAEWDLIGENFWGHRCLMREEILEDGTSVISNLLFVVAGEYDDLDELEDVVLNEDQIDFKNLCDEIIGDG